MKAFKICDLAVSCTLFILLLIASLVRRDETFVYGYFIIGGWQVISMLVHTLAGWFTHKGSFRYIYHRVVACIIVIGLLSPLIPVFFFIFYLLLFAAPIMAIYYMLLCRHEIDFLRKRELIHLKN